MATLITNQSDATKPKNAKHRVTRRAGRTVIYNAQYSFGPCDHACEHVACIEIRRQAESKCRLCGEPIGYMTAYVQDSVRVFPGPAQLVHGACLDQTRNQT